MAFERSEEYMANIMIDALDKEVHLDATIECHWNGTKYKAWCPTTNTNVQFPSKIRGPGRVFVADVVKASTSGRVFYRAYRGSIREKKGSIIGDVIA